MELHQLVILRSRYRARSGTHHYQKEQKRLYTTYHLLLRYRGELQSFSTTEVLHAHHPDPRVLALPTRRTHQWPRHFALLAQDQVRVQALGPPFLWISGPLQILSDHLNQLQHRPRLDDQARLRHPIRLQRLEVQNLAVRYLQSNHQWGSMVLYDSGDRAQFAFTKFQKSRPVAKPCLRDH